ncbi:MAG TPA: sigma 54-interacting transcriptional regulator [Bacteroidales bacterium]|nr:sigma 54-interacting transcriptional regulator [Bacteroidales bacterium]
MWLFNEHFSDAYHRWTCSAAPVHNTSGEIIATINLTGHRDQVHPHTLGMVVGAVQAIESRMESLAVQKQLFDANQYAFTLMNNLTFGVFAVDLNDEIHWVNDTACTSLGIRRIHLLNRPIIELFPDWAHVKRRVLLGEVFIDEEGRFLINKMTEKFMYNSYPIKTPEGEILGFMLTIREYRRMLNLVNRYTGSHARYTFSDIIGTSVAIQQLLSYAKKVALSPSSVLIIGESGTGKEVFAQAIHNASERREGAFVAINCGAIAPTLIESELFGYEEGAFTGARKGGRPGKFELADKGTLFLDEIGEMPLEMQVKLLRTIQE